MKSKKPTPTLDPDTAAAFQHPAVYTNQFFLTVDQAGARLAFTEKREGHPAVIICALYMTHADAAALANLIQTILPAAETPTMQ